MDVHKNLVNLIKSRFAKQRPEPPRAVHLITGRDGEAMAERWLHTQGLTTLARNYRCVFGEIDLIMEQDDILVFVEVRSRKHNRFGSPVETVTRSKQAKIMKTAQHYILARHISDRRTIRFDIVGVTPAADEPIHWLAGAFDANGG